MNSLEQKRECTRQKPKHPPILQSWNLKSAKTVVTSPNLKKLASLEAMGHEIITLQFGNYANYVGTHFWNTQVKVAILCDD